jgi:spermidine synthase
MLVTLVLLVFLGGFGVRYPRDEARRLLENPPRFEEIDTMLGFGHVVRYQRELYRARSSFQDIAVVDTGGRLGRVMLIDDAVMFTELDEANYHEMIAHVSVNFLVSARVRAQGGTLGKGTMMVGSGGDSSTVVAEAVEPPVPLRVLIVGGGDGGTLTRVLAHSDAVVGAVTIVDLDEVVITAARRYFPRMADAFADPRVEAFTGNGARFARDAVARGDAYDIVLVDSTDFNAGSALFSERFHRDAAALVGARRGVLAFNFDSPTSAPDKLVALVRSLRGFRRESGSRGAGTGIDTGTGAGAGAGGVVDDDSAPPAFAAVHPFQAFIPTYVTGHYAFVIAAVEGDPRTEPVLDRRVAERLNCTYYSPDVHHAAFALPRAIDVALGSGVHPIASAMASVSQSIK